MAKGSSPRVEGKRTFAVFPSAKLATGIGTTLAEVAIPAGMLLLPAALGTKEQPLVAYLKPPSLGIGEIFFGCFGFRQWNRDLYGPTDPPLPLC
jgi:hypothetical protein